MAEESIRFTLDKILKPLGIEISVKTMIEAASGNNDVINELKVALYTFLSSFLFSSKQDARKWVRQASIHQAVDVLRLLGFDPFLFNLDESAQHILLALSWLIWRFDMFYKLYSPFYPEEDKQYLPPYSECLNDPTIGEVKRTNISSITMDEKTKRIQRLFGRISTQLSVLSDLEMTREAYNIQIRSIDPESSLYSLSLKANIPLLSAHIDALNRAIENHPKIKEIFQHEKAFWEWITPIANRPSLDPSKFDELNALPVDWFPDATPSPFTRFNNYVDALTMEMKSLKQSMSEMSHHFSTKRKRDGSINSKQYDIICRDINEKIDLLSRLEKIPDDIKDKQTESHIPTMTFKEFSDIELMRIIDSNEDQLDEIANKFCPILTDIANDHCQKLGLNMQGWEIEKYERKRVLDDYIRKPLNKDSTKSVKKPEQKRPRLLKK